MSSVADAFGLVAVFEFLMCSSSTDPTEGGVLSLAFLGGGCSSLSLLELDDEERRVMRSTGWLGPELPERRSAVNAGGAPEDEAEGVAFATVPADGAGALCCDN